MSRSRPIFTAIAAALSGSILLGGPAPAQAQQPAKDLVPLKGTITGPLTPFFTVPVEPPIAVANFTATGQLDPVGAGTWISSGVVGFGADGVPMRETNGVAAFTAANGDALFISFSGIIRATAAGLEGDQVFMITGGKGRFAGATGSGRWRGAVDTVKNVATAQLEGIVTKPK